MESTKYCPNCRQQYELDVIECTCGYEFIQVVEIDEAFSTNTILNTDSVPEFVWKLASITPISGLILTLCFWHIWPKRAKICLRMTIITSIVVAVIIIAIIVIFIGVKNCDIVWSEKSMRKYGC